MRSSYERTQFVEAMIGKIVAWVLFLSILPEVALLHGWKMVGVAVLTLLFGMMSAACESRAEVNLKQVHEDHLLLGEA